MWKLDDRRSGTRAGTIFAGRVPRAIKLFRLTVDSSFLVEANRWKWSLGTFVARLINDYWNRLSGANPHIDSAGDDSAG